MQDAYDLFEAHDRREAEWYEWLFEEMRVAQRDPDSDGSLSAGIPALVAIVRRDLGLDAA